MSFALRCRRSALSSFVAVLATATAASAQSPEVPSASPPASVTQRVGVTDLSVDYSSPGVKGRKIFGSLVPYDQVWRTGANETTRFESSTDFTFGDTRIEAGTYALFTIPGKDSWTVILNTAVKSWGSTDYNKKYDVARVTVKPQTLTTPRERMTFLFSDTTDDATRLDLEWDKVRVSVPVKVDTNAIVLSSIEEAANGAWRPLYTSARYLLDSKGDLDKALGYINTSIDVKPTWSNTWVKAQILGQQGKNAEAVKAAQQAQALGKGERVYEGFYKGTIAKAIEGWKK